MRFLICPSLFPKGVFAALLVLMVQVKQQQCAFVQLWSCQTLGMRLSMGILFCPIRMKCVDELVLCPMPFRLTHNLGSRYVGVFGRAHGLWGQSLQEMKDSVVEFTTLQDMLDKPFGALSKGMKQRAALATVLMHDPQLLILDEPAAGLDPRARVELRTLLRLLADQEKTILISSHILAELTEICTHAVVIEQGCLKANRSLTSVQEAVSSENKTSGPEEWDGKTSGETIRRVVTTSRVCLSSC